MIDVLIAANLSDKEIEDELLGLMYSVLQLIFKLTKLGLQVMILRGTLYHMRFIIFATTKKYCKK